MWFKRIFEEKGEPSSKRIFGGIGFIAILVCGVFASFSKLVETPDILEGILWASTTLLLGGSVADAIGGIGRGRHKE